MSSPRTREPVWPKGRLEALSDGVFAIAITLLVLEIAIPTVAGKHLMSELWAERQIFLAYFIAFMALGVVWMEHAALAHALVRIDGVMMRLNLLLLLFVAFLPFPTRVMSDYFHARDLDGERVGVVLFGVVLLLQILVVFLMVRHAESHKLFGEHAAEERSEESRLKYQLVPALVAYGIATVLGIFSPWVGTGLYLLIAVYLAVPVGVVRGIVGRGGSSDPEEPDPGVQA
jgi:uncharacterized membrane protein